MKRRRVLAAMGAVLAGLPLRLPAQQSKKPARIGYLATGGPVSFPITVESFRNGMRELGYTEGRDYVLEIRSAEGIQERHATLAMELVRLKVDVIVVSSTPAGLAANKATTTIPIVLSSSADPVASGLAKSLARPGGNATGLTNITADLAPKRLEMLKILLPDLSKVAVLLNVDNPNMKLERKNVETAARRFGVKVIPAEVKGGGNLEAVFAAAAKERPSAIIVPLDGFLVQQRQQIAGLALKYRLPSLFSSEDGVAAGGLMSYGQNIPDGFRRAAGYVDKILKGAKPGELPIEQPTKFEIAINLKTAKTLGITIPKELHFRADRVIE